MRALYTVLAAGGIVGVVFLATWAWGRITDPTPTRKKGVTQLGRI